MENKNKLFPYIPWFLPLVFSAVLAIFAWIIQERGQDLASTVALTQTHAITLAPILCFLLGKKSAKTIGRKFWFVIYQPFIIAVTYLLMFLKRESTPLFTLSLFGWSLLWTALSYIRIPANWWPVQYQRYLLPLVSCAYVFVSLCILGFAMWEDMASIFLPIINTFLLILPVLCFSYGKITKNNRCWFILYQALIPCLPILLLFWGYWLLTLCLFAILPWCLLWGFLGRICGKKSVSKKENCLSIYSH